VLFDDPRVAALAACTTTAMKGRGTCVALWSVYLTSAAYEPIERAFVRDVIRAYRAGISSRDSL
jgi:hypothetical protein